MIPGDMQSLQGGNNFQSSPMSTGMTHQGHQPAVYEIDQTGNKSLLRPATGNVPGQPPQGQFQTPMSQPGQVSPEQQFSPWNQQHVPLNTPTNTPPNQSTPPYTPQPPVYSPPNQPPSQYPPQNPPVYHPPNQPPIQYPPYQPPVYQPPNQPHMNQQQPQQQQQPSIYNQLRNEQSPPAQNMNPFQIVKEAPPQTPIQGQQQVNQPQTFDQYAANFKNVDQGFVQKAYSQGLSPEQAQTMYQEIEMQKSQMQNRQIESMNKKFENTEAILQGVWGQAFDKNMETLVNHVASQTPHPGDQAQYEKQIKENLKPILSNHTLAQNMLNVIGGNNPQHASNPLSVQGTPNNKGAQGNVQQYQNMKTEYENLLKFPGKGIGSVDPSIRAQANERLLQLKGYLFQAEQFNQNPQKDFQDPGRQGGFFGGVRRMMGL